MMEVEHKEPPEPVETDFEEEFRDEPRKHGFLQRIWAAITNK